MADHNDLGEAGEEMAIRHLQSKGHKLIEKNWRSNRHEIDIITEFKDRIVFTEVKTRSTNFYGNPEVFVNRKKQKSIILAANHFLLKNIPDGEARFDIISVLMVKGKPIINHIEDAYYPY